MKKSKDGVPSEYCLMAGHCNTSATAKVMAADSTLDVVEVQPPAVLSSVVITYTDEAQSKRYLQMPIHK